MLTFLKNLLTLITDAAPANRNFDCSYVVLENKEGDGHIVGTYIQGFYQLAKVGGLRCQIEAKNYADAATLKQQNPKLYKKLYKTKQSESGNSYDAPKSPFELAVINKVAKNDIQNEITEEYTWQNNDPKGLLPQDVSKYRMVPEWLNKLKHPTSKFGMVGSPQRLTITVDNIVKPKDKWLHATMQVIGMLVTLTTFVGLVMSILPVVLLSSLSFSIGLGIASFFALKTIGFGNVANFFGIGEVLWTDVRALLSKQFLKTEARISWGKLVRSLCFAAAIAMMAFIAASATFSSILALPFIASLGIGAKIIAGLFASNCFMLSCIGASMPVRCFSGFGIWDNTIPMEAINTAEIKPLKEETKLKDEKGSISKFCLTALAPTSAQRKQKKLEKRTEELAAANASVALRRNAGRF